MQLTALIVDDERLSRSYIRNMIAGSEPSIQVFDAGSAEEALAIFQGQHVDLLFLDIKMPGTNGFSLLELLPHRDFELVFITAYGQHALKAIKEGAADYILKPIKKTEFIETLQKVIGRRKLQIAYKQKTEQIAAKQKAAGHAEALQKLDALKKTTILTEDDWEQFRHVFESIYPTFLVALREQYTDLTQAEIRLMAMTRLNMTTREMANSLGISPETIRQTRWRLKKKINLEDDTSLEDVASSL